MFTIQCIAIHVFSMYLNGKHSEVSLKVSFITSNFSELSSLDQSILKVIQI